MNIRWRVLTGLNILAATAGASFGIVAVANPSVLPGFAVASSPGIDFYTQMYALRSVVLAAVVIATMIMARRVGGRGVIAVLVIAGAVQLGDLAIAIANQTPGIAGAAIASLVHLGTIPFVARQNSHNAAG